MGARGNRIIRNEEDPRDAQGRSLPAERFMHFVAIELACKPCHSRGVDTVLGTWAIETHAPAFDPAQVFERGDNRAAQLQEIAEADGTIRRRHRMECPRCGNAPQFREEKILAGLEAFYEQGARAVTRRIHV